MKKEIVKNSILILMIILVVLGIKNILTSYAVSSQTYKPTLAAGEIDPNNFNYHVYQGTWTSTVPAYPPYTAPKGPGDYVVFCCSEVGHVENPGTVYTQASSLSTLPPAVAYVASSDRNVNTGVRQRVKQNAYHLLGTMYYTDAKGQRQRGDGYLVEQPRTDSLQAGAQELANEAIAYAKYDSQVRTNGISVTDNTGKTSIKVNTNTREYTAGPFNISYGNGVQLSYGNINFGGISGLTLVGYNKFGKEIKEIPIERILSKNSTTGVEEVLGKLQYFEPDATTKVDKREQKYPTSGQDFNVVFKNPNEGLEYNDTNRITSVKIKVKFKFMLANGKYVKYKGRYYWNEEYPVYDGEGNVTGYDSVEKSSDAQPLIAADAIRSIYELEITPGATPDDDNDTNTPDNTPDNTPTNEPDDMTMTFAGRVWEDDVMGKESEVDGIRQDEEKAVPNIPVILYDDKGKAVDQTTTDTDGKYEFKDLDAMRKYYVEFKYNGQQYQNTKYNNILDDKHSVATETTSERDALNKKFEEIDGDEGYTLEQLDYSDKYYNAPDIFTISAFTGSDGKNKIVQYPEESQFTIGNSDTVSEKKQYPALYKETKSVKYINLGITKRIEFDAALKKDLLSAVVKVNGKTEIYGYDKKQIGNDDGTTGDTWTIQVVGGYDRDVDDTDWNFRGQNGNKDGLLQVYVTYKVAVRNQSMSMLGHITKLYDYYDESFEYIPELSWQSDKNYKTSKKALAELRGYIEGGSTSNLGKTPKAKNADNTLTIDVDKKQKTGETQYIYLTFKIKNDESGKVRLGKKTNAVEIGAFKTYYQTGTKLPHYAGVNDYVISNDTTIAGRVDKDSIPSNMGRNGTPKEDDEDTAPGLDVKLTGKTRILNGTAWEDERTKNENGAVIGDGIMGDNDVKIAGIKVQLIEKTVWNKANQTGEYMWAETTTGADGKYKFDSYPAGDYIVRFTYGEDLSGASQNNGKSYNGQDYKTTTYQAGIAQTGTTDLDGKYQAYTDVVNQNATGTYGYNIATKKDNVSDAKDIWADRQKVIDYSKENVTNHKAEVLASPYTANAGALKQELIDNTRMTAETGVIVVEVERNMQSNEENGEPSYSLENVNIGLEERPKAQLELDKSIANIKVTLANGSVLFDVNKSKDDVIWKDHKEYNAGSKKDNGKYEEYYGVNGKHRYSYREQIDNNIVTNADKGLVQLTMDEELMHGATIEILYKVKVTNVGEIDYEGQSFYYTGTGANQVVTTRADQIVDYVANNLQFTGANANNAGWNLIKKETLTSEGLVNNSLASEIAKFNNIIETSDLKKALVPAQYSGDKVTNADAASVEKTLVLTQLITPENTADNLTYSNIAEIVKTSNTVGRRMAYSVVGNQNPTAANASEIDSCLAEKVIILPPFGNTHIYYILGAVISIILIGGIAFIIKKVVNK